MGTYYFATNSIASSVATSTISLFNNLSTGILNIGGSGSVRLCSTIYFTTNSIASSVATNTISLFNNLTRGGMPPRARVFCLFGSSI